VPQVNAVRCLSCGVIVAPFGSVELVWCGCLPNIGLRVGVTAEKARGFEDEAMWFDLWDHHTYKAGFRVTPAAEPPPAEGPPVEGPEAINTTLCKE